MGIPSSQLDILPRNLLNSVQTLVQQDHLGQLGLRDHQVKQDKEVKEVVMASRESLDYLELKGQRVPLDHQVNEGFLEWMVSFQEYLSSCSRLWVQVSVMLEIMTDRVFWHKNRKSGCLL